MIKLKQLLLEVHLQDLFHATQHDYFLDMLKDNAIKLAFAGGTQADQFFNKGRHFFLSTMRQKYGNYARGRVDQMNLYYDTIVHLDGQKLTASGFKVYPIDFWQMGPDASEQEERVVSDKDEITPLNKFIKSVHIYVGDIKNPFSLERLHEINQLSKKYNFPIYFYKKGTEAYFKAQRTEKATTNVEEIIPQPNFSPADLEHKEFLKTHPSGRYDRSVEYIRIFLDIYYNKPIDLTKHPAKSVIKWLRYYPHDAYSQLFAEAHNLKKAHPPIFRELVDVMKKGKFKTFKDLITFVIDREQKKEKDKRDAEYAEYKKRQNKTEP